MTRFIIRRLLQSIPTLIGITILSFTIMRVAPGDPVRQITFDPNISEKTRDALRHQFGLDQPIHVHYVSWLWDLLHGDLGISVIQKRPVLKVIAERVPATLELTFTALLIGLIIGVPVGVFSAVRQRGIFDNLARFFAVVFNAVPVFWLGLVIILIFSVKFKEWGLPSLPSGGRVDPVLAFKAKGAFNLGDRLRHLLPPALVLSTGWLALFTRYMRTEVLEVIRQDYVRTARAKGLSNRVVYLVHALRNALIPLVTVLGPALAGLLGGAVVTERVFSWPGMGRLAIDAVFQRDYPVVMGNVVIGAVLVVLGYLLSDILYAVVDPRIRLE